MTTNADASGQPNGEEEAISRNTPRIKDEAVKNIIVHRNGDMITEGRRIVFNKRQIRTWDSFLEQLTRSLRPQRAAIQRLATPNHGHVVKSFEDLNPNSHYVAVANGEKFRLIDYLGINHNNPRLKRKGNGIRLPPIIPVYHSKLKVGSRLADNYQRTVKYIHVYRNGDEFTPSIGVLLTKRYQRSMETLMIALEDKIVLPQNKPLRRVYTMEGNLVTSIDEIQDNTHYVAATHEPFQNVNYGQVLPAIHGGRVPRKEYENVKYLFKMPTPAKTLRDGNQSTSPRGRETVSPARNKSRKDNEAQKKEDKQKTEAATKIQSSFRGFQTRQDVQNNKQPKSMSQYRKEQEEVKKKNEAEKKKSEPDKQQQKQPNQASDKKQQDNKRNEAPKEENNKKMTQEEAATTIQSSVRGYQTRQSVNTTKQQKEATENRDKSDKAATVIQSSYRGYKTRSEMGVTKK